MEYVAIVRSEVVCPSLKESFAFEILSTDLMLDKGYITSKHAKVEHNDVI